MSKEVSVVLPAIHRISVRGGLSSLVALVGDHDLATAPELRDVLNAAVESGLVVLDFNRCSFVDSTILGVIAGMGRRAAALGHRVVGVNATGLVRNALRLTAQDDLLLDDSSLDDEHVSALLQWRAAESASS